MLPSLTTLALVEPLAVYALGHTFLLVDAVTPVCRTLYPRLPGPQHTAVDRYAAVAYRRALVQGLTRLTRPGGLHRRFTVTTTNRFTDTLPGSAAPGAPAISDAACRFATRRLMLPPATGCLTAVALPSPPGSV